MLPLASIRLPAEILLQIYYLLGSVDFNSARHVCRSWYLRSLDLALLHAMLKRGGWSSSLSYELAQYSRTKDTANIQHVSEEWLTSKLIARECALSVGWTGNGFSSEAQCSPFVQISEIDFTELGVQQLTGAGIFLTLSSCCGFFLAVQGCLIHIYALNQDHRTMDSNVRFRRGDLRLVNSFVCPRRILACSMDTSYGRYAVAVLVDGRMGITFSLNEDFNANQPETAHSPFRNYNGNEAVGLSTNFNDTNIINLPSQTDGLSRTGPHESQSRTTIQQVEDQMPENLQHSPPRGSKIAAERMDLASLNDMHVERSQSNLFRDLCHMDDPPRSVAICPQRRCVAFGCGSGIELHWVDALTGQNLSRHFPLGTPSDYLYFLPPRKGVDGFKKLRLISSAGRAGERSALGENFFGVGTAHDSLCKGYDDVHQSLLEPWTSSRLISGSLNWLGLHSRPTYDQQYTPDASDHYHAVPLSDGYHILFTDPATRTLCLGSDAPFGGPSKLLRKVWFKGPHKCCTPAVYAAGKDLRWGIRVVVAYDLKGSDNQVIMLFSVPRDLLVEITGTATSYNASTAAQSELPQLCDEWRYWCGNRGSISLKTELSDASGGDSSAPRSVQITGQKIGDHKAVMDVGIDSGPNFVIWIIGKNGIVEAWTLRRG